MENKEQDFINRYKNVQESIVKAMDKALERAIINISKSKIWDDWLQLTQYFPNKDSEYYEAAYVRYNAYDSPTEVYSGFGETEVESRAMLLFDLLEKKILTPDGLNLKEVDRRKEYENEFE